MEKDLKGQMEDILAVEREKNNKAFAPVKKGEPAPLDVRLAKIAHVKRRISEGASRKKAIAETNISERTYYDWIGQLAGRPSYDTNKKAKKAFVAEPKHKPKTHRHTYTEAQRAEAITKASQLMAKGYSQTEAAERIGLTQGTISRWILGRVPVSGLDRRRRVAATSKKKKVTMKRPVKKDNGKAPASKTEYVSIDEALAAYRNTVNPDDFEKELLRAIIRRSS